MIRTFFSTLRRVISIGVEAPVTAETLAAVYAAMPEVKLRALNERDLTPEARALRKAEIARRDRQGRGADRVA